MDAPQDDLNVVWSVKVTQDVSRIVTVPDNENVWRFVESTVPISTQGWKELCAIVPVIVLS